MRKHLANKACYKEVCYLTFRNCSTPQQYQRQLASSLAEFDMKTLPLIAWEPTSLSSQRSKEKSRPSPIFPLLQSPSRTPSSVQWSLAVAVPSKLRVNIHKIESNRKQHKDSMKERVSCLRGKKIRLANLIQIH